jgi:heme oxygenase (biliverdin-IX-beta and delta-forming)
LTVTEARGRAAHIRLRAATAEDHARVDEVFGAFDLSTRAGYAAFLRAHARALAAVEAALDGGSLPVPLRPRLPLLAADLKALGETIPAPLPLDAPAGPAEAFGMAYVLDGSRLGGAMIARTVPAGLPKAYLSASHEPGEWRGFLASLDAAANGQESWIEAAITAGRRVFALYADAAGLERRPLTADRSAR